jgi:hypothetical protein
MNDSSNQPLFERFPSPASNEFLEMMALLSKITHSSLTNTVEPKYLTVQDAASYCRLAVQTIYNNRKHIARMPGVRKLLFTREALDNWLATRPTPRRKRK